MQGGGGRYPQNAASLAGTFSVQSREKLPVGSLETSPPIDGDSTRDAVRTTAKVAGLYFCELSNPLLSKVDIFVQQPDRVNFRVVQMF